MSYVTNVILSFSIVERQEPDEEHYVLMRRINAYLVAQGKGAFGPNADAVAGGTKHLETPLFVAAFNYLDLAELVAYMRTLPWEAPQDVQLFVQEEGEDRFFLVELGTRAQLVHDREQSLTLEELSA